jgi:hypothetical protein
MGVRGGIGRVRRRSLVAASGWRSAASGGSHCQLNSCLDSFFRQELHMLVFTLSSLTVSFSLQINQAATW